MANEATCDRGNRAETYVSNLAKDRSSLSSNRHRTRLTSRSHAGKHVRSCIVYTWDHKSSAAFWAGMKVYVHIRVAGMAKEVLADG